jgi:hypothetical protein
MNLACQENIKPTVKINKCASRGPVIMHTLQEYKDASTLDAILQLANKTDTPRSVGIISLVEFMRSQGQTDDFILKVLKASLRITVE